MRICLLLAILIASIHAFADENIAVMGVIGDKIIMRVDGSIRTLSMHETSPEGIRLLSIDSEHRQVLLDVNGKKKRYILGAGTESSRGSTIIKPDKIGMYRVDGRINNNKVSFIVDTGATFVTINQAVADKLNIDKSEAKLRGQAETGNGMIPIYVVGRNKVEVGGLVLKNIDIAVHEGKYPKQALLGMSFLKKVKIEHVSGSLRLKKR